MKRLYRLRKSSDFEKVIGGVKLQTKNSTIFYLSNGLSHSRIGISVKKKIGNAVIRNKYKRQVKAIIRENFDFSLSLDIVIILKQNYGNFTYQVNEQLIVDAINNIEVNK